MPSSVSRRTLLCGAGGGLAAAAILRRPAHAAEFSYKFASVLPPDHPMMLRCTEAIAKIKEQSSGRFEIALYPNSALGADTSMLAQCVSGAVEMYALQGDLLAPRVPAAGIIGVGFAFPSYKEVWPAIDGELGDFVRAQAEKSNMICLKRAWDHGFREITSRNKPINSPADLKGFKIGLPVAPIPISLFKRLGAAPTAINFSEVLLPLFLVHHRIAVPKLAQARAESGNGCGVVTGRYPELRSGERNRGQLRHADHLAFSACRPGTGTLVFKCRRGCLGSGGPSAPPAIAP